MSKTLNKLAAQWTENTGSHFLDSGGANGRNWQRNQGKTPADFLAPGAGQIDDYGCISVNTFQLCADHFSYTDTSRKLTKQFRKWVDTMPKGDAYYNTPGSFEEFLETVLGITDHQDFNTYNWENFLDQVLQGVEFNYDGTRYIALSYHGGADVRGGYTNLVVYRGCEDWAWSANMVNVYCRGCDTRWDNHGDGYSFHTEDDENGNAAEFPGGKCSNCQHTLTVSTYSECDA